MPAAYLAFLAAASGSGCGAARPAPAEVRAIAADPDAYAGRCVILVAYSDGRTLFGGRQAIRRTVAIGNLAAAWHAMPNEMMGVYGLPKLSDALTERGWTRGLKWRLVGLVSSCEAMDREAKRKDKARPPEPGGVTVTMLGGYCHYVDGAVLFVERATLLAGPSRPPPLTRARRSGVRGG
jgi:hypothetical protein